MSEQRGQVLTLKASLISAIRSSWLTIGVAGSIWGYLLQHLKYRTEIHILVERWRDLTRGFWSLVLPTMEWPDEVKDFLSFTGLAVVAGIWAFRRNRYVVDRLHPGVEWLGIVTLGLYGLLLAAPLFKGIYDSGAVDNLGNLKSLGWGPIWLTWSVLFPAYFVFRKHHKDIIPEQLRPMSAIWVLPAVLLMCILVFLTTTPIERMAVESAPLIAMIIYFSMLWTLARINGYVGFFQSAVVLAVCLALDKLYSMWA